MDGDVDSPQPSEGVDALSDLAAALEPKNEGEQPNPEEAEDEDGESEEVEGDESPEEAEEEAENDSTVKIKHDGKDVELKLSEALRLAQMGFDYDKKTMAVAEQRKAVEAEQAQVAEIRQRHTAALEQSEAHLTAFYQYSAAQLGEPPDISLAQYDAASYLAQKELYEQRKGQLQQAIAGIEHLRNEQHRQRQADLATKAQATRKALADTLPGWDEKAETELTAYLASNGLTFQTAADGYLQKGLWELAHKAKAFDALKAKQSEMKPVKQLAKVQKPAANNTPGKVAERAKRDAAFAKNASIDTLAAYFK